VHSDRLVRHNGYITSDERPPVTDIASLITLRSILDIEVAVGDQVKAGQTVAILEAMKMENNINAECDGVITAIKVSKGDNILEGSDIVIIG